ALHLREAGRVRGGQVVARGVREDHAEAERVVHAVPLVDPDLRGRVRPLQQDRQEEPGRAAAHANDVHADAPCGGGGFEAMGRVDASGPPAPPGAAPVSPAGTGSRADADASVISLPDRELAAWPEAAPGSGGDDVARSMT